MNYPQELLDQAKAVHGSLEFDKYLAYETTPEELRQTLSREIVTSHNNIKSTLDKMVEYGNNKWWMITQSASTGTDKRHEKAVNDMILNDKRKKVFYQIFDCGLSIRIIQHSILMNNLNDLMTPYGITITSYFLEMPKFFVLFKKKILLELARNPELTPLVEAILTEDAKNNIS